MSTQMDGIQIIVTLVEVGVVFFGSLLLRDRGHFWVANSLVLAVSLLAMESGPRSYGSEWLYEGFPAGWILGSFMDVFSYARDLALAEAESKELRNELKRLKATT
jgi:hypothetical protein